VGQRDGGVRVALAVGGGFSSARGRRWRSLGESPERVRHGETVAAGQSFVKTVTVGKNPDDVMQQIISATASATGYIVTMGGNHTLILTRKYTPQWAIVVAVIGIFFFLIGLLALLVKETETLTVTVALVNGGTRINATGLGTPELISRLESVARSLPAAS
jgi:hypothetical protein